jgi:hypothetical protein
MMIVRSGEEFYECTVIIFTIYSVRARTGAITCYRSQPDLELELEKNIRVCQLPIEQ